MSMLPFARNFFAVQGNKATYAVTKALVQMDPESASAADLRTMEQDLDKAGQVISRLRTDLNNERREFDSVNLQYGELMSAAEVLQKKIDAAADADRGSLETSLANLLNRTEHMAPELERDRKDVDATQALLTDAEKAYQDKARALTEARGNLDRARHDLQHANIEEERSRQRAQQAAIVAGLSASPIGGLTIALNTMQESATEARQRAESADMKANALRGAKSAAEDENVAAALNEVRGTISPKSLSERLASLRR
jgi:predicted  nucleic acid-binding Zn-ribbon protein